MRVLRTDRYRYLGISEGYFVFEEVNWKRLPNFKCGRLLVQEVKIVETNRDIVILLSFDKNGIGKAEITKSSRLKDTSLPLDDSTYVFEQLLVV